MSAILDDGRESHTTTAVNGVWKFDALVPGKYALTASMIAMKQYHADGVTVENGKTTRWNIVMSLPDGNLGTLGEEDRFTAGSFNLIGQKPVPSGPTPRLPDGKPDLSGFWWAERVAGPQEPPELRPQAEAIRRQRVSNAMRDLPTARCLPGGIVDPAGKGRFVHTSSLLVMLIGPPVTLTYFETRQIFLDGRSHPRDANPTWLGYSISHWEGDTLVVDTTGFNGLAW